MESAYNTSKAASEELLDCLLGDNDLNYVGHRACVHGASTGTRNEREYSEMVELSRKKLLVGVQEKQLLYRATRDRAWLSDLPHHLRSTELSLGEFWDNLRLQYGLMPKDIPVICDGCS